MSLSPPSLNFGPLVIGQTSTQSFQLVNTGGPTLNGSAATTLPFAIQSGSPFSLTPGQTGLVAVSLSPTSAASFSNLVVFSSNGGNSGNSITGAGALPPTADFVGSPTMGTWPLTVSFTDHSTGTITNGFWDFGDGATTNTVTANLMHTYQGAGTNTVSLTVSGPVGTDTLTRPGYIVVTNLPPVIITIQISSNQVQLTWLAGALQSASQVTGPYTNVTTATSPYSVPPSDATRFFRVKVR